MELFTLRLLGACGAERCVDMVPSLSRRAPLHRAGFCWARRLLRCPPFSARDIYNPLTLLAGDGDGGGQDLSIYYPSGG